MAKLPLPDRGYPIDTTYLYQIADVVNDLATQVSSSQFNYTTVKTREASNQTIRTSEARMVAGYVDLITSENVIAGTTRAFNFDYPSDFKYAPIAVATPVNTGNTPVGNDVTIVLTSVTTSRVDGFVKFASTGTMSLSINIILIGIPT
jgi:hypothetical protein